MDLGGKKFNLRQKMFDIIIIIAVSIIFALTIASIIYKYAGIRDGISIVFFGLIIVLFSIFFMAIKKPTSCFVCK